MQNLSPSHRSNKKGSIRFYILLTFTLLIAIFAIRTANSKQDPLLDPQNQALVLGIKQGYQQNSDLEKIVLKHTQNTPGKFAVVIEQLTPDNPQQFALNENVIYPAGSLYKLFLMAAALKEVEQGTLSLDTAITADVEHLVDVLGGEEFGYEDKTVGELTYTVDEILTRIATISDNYASIMLAEKIGWDKVQAQAEIIGAKSTIIKSPISTTAADLTLFFRQLYQQSSLCCEAEKIPAKGGELHQGEIVSKASSDKIIDLLSRSKLNNRIPAYLPTSIEDAPQTLKIAHKTGELPRTRHDAGLVYLGGNPYLIILLSKDLKYEDDGVEALAQISKEVYDYFSKGDKGN